MESPLVPQVLLQHGQFVRALARSLLRDGHAAEDVAQDTWARYLEKRPDGERGLRQWFRVVVRNVAVNRGRTERGRTAREQGAARAEALPSTHEELEHSELLGVVVQTVLALEEPYRSTIVERYYRGLDAETIAQQSGTTAATVRSREHRALEKLRERLDRHCKGERGAWAVALARLAGPSPSVASSPRWPAGVKIAVPLVVVAAGVVLWLRPPATSGAASPAPSVASASAGPVIAALTTAALAPSAAPAETRTALGSSSEARENAGNASLCEIHGRFVLPGGAPAAHATLAMMGWGRNQEAELQYGEPENWIDPRGETDDDGRFVLRFEPPRAYQFTLEVKVPGYAGAEWRWDEIAPGATLDLGEIELPVGGTIEGHMVDAQGAPLLGEEWLVYARTVGLGEDDGRDDTQVIAVVDGATGAFRLEDVWPTQVKLQADSDMANWIDGPTVSVRSRETATADIVYSGPSNARRITVVTVCRSFFTHNNPAPESIRLSGPAGEVRTAHDIDGSSQSHSFDDLAPGAYTVEIDDPAYLPWSRTGVMPGESVTAHLVGSAALRLEVVDAAGQPVERYAVRVTLRSSSWRPNEFELHDGQSVLAEGLLRGMLPGDCTVAIRCADGATARCEVHGLQSGETRTVRIELGSQLFASGRVVHDGGEGVAGVDVLLLTPALQADSEASPILPPGGRTNVEDLYRKQLASVETDVDGAFRFDVTSSGPFLLRARADGSQVFSPPFTLDAARPDLELVLPKPGSVRGRVLAPAGASLEGLALWIAPSALWTSAPPPGPAGLLRVSDVRESLAHAVAPLGSDGAFELERLPPVPSRAFLLIADRVEHGFTLTDSGVSGAVQLAELEVPAAGVLQREFEAPELPGWAALELRVNGQPAPFLEVTLRGVTDVRGRTDAAGRFGPERVPAGSWSVFASDREAGWGGRLPPSIVVEAGREARAVIDAQVIAGSLTCDDAAGQPLAEESVTVLRVDEYRPGVTHSFLLTTRKTDANGRLSLQLLEGAYALHRGPYVPGQTSPATVPLTWTSSGPLNERVQL